MKVSKLDKSAKLFALYAQLGTMFRIDTVQGDIILDPELKAAVFGAIEPILKKRAAKGETVPVFDGAEQIDFVDAQVAKKVVTKALQEPFQDIGEDTGLPKVKHPLKKVDD